jgi:hypothetical protein
VVHEAFANYNNDVFEELVGEFYYVNFSKTFKPVKQDCSMLPMSVTFVFCPLKNALYVGIPHIWSKSLPFKTKERIVCARVKDMFSNKWKTYYSSHDIVLEIPDVGLEILV